MKIKLMSLVKEGHGRLEDVVFQKWRGIQYVKNYNPREGEPSARQKEVAAAFMAMIAVWKSLPGIVHRAWHEFTKEENMTGYNAFIGANMNRYRAGELLELAVGMGDQELAGITASPGTGAGDLVVRATGMKSGAHLTVFTQRVEDGRAAGAVMQHPAGATDTLTVQGLEPGAGYHVYALATDAPCPDAKHCSAAFGVEGKAAA